MAKKMLDTCQNIVSRPGDALMITVELTVYPHVPRACGGRGADLHRVLCLLPTCLNPPGPVQDSLQILYDARHPVVGGVAD